MSSPATRLVDCDVHCAVPSAEVLLPYLDEYWQAYLRDNFLKGASSGSGRLHVTGGMSLTYPAWAESLAMSPDDVTLDRMQAGPLAAATAVILQCYFGVETFTHPYFAPALATAVNRWLADEWLDRDERLLASALVAPQHTASAVEEVHRVGADRRFAQLYLPARAWDPYGTHRYWPIWEAAAEHDLVLGIHYGGAVGTPPTPVNWTGSFFEHHALAQLQFESHIPSLVFSGIFDKLPDLKVAIVESGWTWLPPLLWRMDWEWKASRREVPWVTEPPSEYVRRHFRFTTQPCDGPDDLAQLGQVIEQLESDELLMFGSDYPRRYELGIEQLSSVLTDEQTERVLWRNAWDTYGLDTRLQVAATA